MKHTVNVNDTLWKEERIALWEGTNRHDGNKKEIENRRRLFIGEIESPFHYKGKQNIIAIVRDLFHSPHQCEENWREWIDQLCDKWPEQTDREEIENRIINGFRLVVSFGYYYWSPEATLKLFKKVFVEKPGLTEPLKPMIPVRSEYLLDMITLHLEYLLMGRRDPGSFDPEWYELFKNYLGDIDTTIFFPQSASRSKRRDIKYVLTVTEVPGEYPGKINYYDLKLKMFDVFEKVWWPERSINPEEIEDLSVYYKGMKPSEVIAYPVIANLREMIKSDLTNGTFPPAIVALSHWSKDEHSSRFVLRDMGYHRRRYFTASEAYAREKRVRDYLEAKSAKVFFKEDAQLLKKLVKKYDGKPVLEVLETVRQCAVECEFIEDGPSWNNKVLDFLQWLSIRKGFEDDIFEAMWLDGTVEKLRVLESLHKKQSPDLYSHALMTVFSEHERTFATIEKRSASDKKRNRVYGYVWDFVIDQIEGERENAHSRFEVMKNEKGIVDRCFVEVDSIKHQHRFDYKMSNTKSKIVKDIGESIKIFEAVEALPNRLFVHVMKGSYFSVHYLPAGFAKFF